MSQVNNQIHSYFKIHSKPSYYKIMPFCFQDENCFLHDYGTFTIMVHLSTKMIGKALILIFFNFQATFIIFQIYYIPILIFPNHIKESILTIIIL